MFPPKQATFREQLFTKEYIYGKMLSKYVQNYHTFTEKRNKALLKCST
jgi:hypothetical protein